MLDTVDLFSGVGGLSHALRGIVKPHLFCEIERHATSLLHERYPSTPVWGDVRTLTRAAVVEAGHTLPARIDLVMGGFPCVGFSTYGKLEGFEEAQSNLFYNLLRVVDDLQPRLVFMENVSNILKMGMREVCKQYHARGYRLRWCVLAAREIGAPHARKRWFCLASKSDAENAAATAADADANPVITTAPEAYAPHDWSRAPETMIAKSNTLLRRTVRYSLLGNAVVPDAVRWAFLYLMGGLASPPTMAPDGLRLSALSDATEASQAWDHVAKFPKHGSMCEAGYVRTHSETRPADPYQHPPLRMDPAAFAAPVTRTRPHRGDAPVPIPGPITHAAWATPRASLQGGSYVLTQRTMHDLNTQVRFADVTPDHLRSGYLNPAFVEWMMGFPEGWTHLGHKPPVNPRRRPRAPTPSIESE